MIDACARIVDGTSCHKSNLSNVAIRMAYSPLDKHKCQKTLIVQPCRRFQCKKHLMSALNFLVDFENLVITWHLIPPHHDRSDSAPDHKDDIGVVFPHICRAVV